MNKIYLLEYNKFYYYDPKDDENVEEIRKLGYFSTREKAEEIKKKIVSKNEYPEENLMIVPIEFKTSKKQKYVYVLSYGYSIKEKDEYDDYYYFFPPMTNRKKCLLLMKKLQNEKKYMHSKEKIYDEGTKYGFLITRIKIDEFYDLIR